MRPSVPSSPTARIVAGLPPAIDAAAEAAAVSHRFLRRQWYRAATHAYGGTARTIVVTCADRVRMAMPLTALGPAWLGMGQVPGCYWPFRSVPVATDAATGDFAVLLHAAAGAVRGFRLGPIYDDDPALAGLLAAAAPGGWRALPRHVADSYLLDIAAVRAAGPWPRSSTLKKNRFHEKHLAAHGTLAWSFVTGADWTGAAFDALAAIERASWIAARTDGGDAKFTDTGHGGFWRDAARDPVIADMMWAALLQVDGMPAAFSFDLNAGPLKYAVANSYDPRFARYSPGKLLYYRNMIDAVERGTTLVDWGAGDSGYKRVIGAAAGPAIRDWLFLRPGIPAAIGRWIAPRWHASGQPHVAERGHEDA